ncbi:hypothetical protein [Hymenobacter fodinae]|uniref:Uncharacterized protein n=1 Tax=Hymenobacter fodinae TaxID=2510796 RepID=A0A4Z0P074_9BACT|nr:hypothetical protein [Hymenobacter fodinae]TGE04654.1 hypothetical protein EU556_20935 [Hymenobacter fodinae]
MKRKTINAILSKKFNDFVNSIEDEDVKSMVEKNTIITGGSITSMLLNEDVNDYDLYFRNRKTALAVAKYYVARFSVKNKSGIDCPIYVDETDDRVKIVIKSAGIASEDGTTKDYEYFEGGGDAAGYISEVMQDPGAIEDAYQETELRALEARDDGKPRYRPVFMSTNAITLANQVQIILRFFGEPEEIHKNYDYVHCTNYWTSWENKVTLHQEALEAILAKELRYVGSKYPLCSVFRMRKFIRRGWQINAGQILKMIMQVSELDLTDHAVLEDQLTGVDVAYFVEVVSKLKDKDPEKVNAAYLVEIIDRMF